MVKAVETYCYYDLRSCYSEEKKSISNPIRGTGPLLDTAERDFEGKEKHILFSFFLLFYSNVVTTAYESYAPTRFVDDTQQCIPRSCSRTYFGKEKKKEGEKKRQPCEHLDVFTHSSIGVLAKLSDNPGFFLIFKPPPLFLIF